MTSEGKATAHVKLQGCTDTCMRTFRFHAVRENESRGHKLTQGTAGGEMIHSCFCTPGDNAITQCAELTLRWKNSHCTFYGRTPQRSAQSSECRAAPA